MTWLTANAGTILVSIILVVLVGLVIRKMVTDRKKGSPLRQLRQRRFRSIHAAGKSCDNPHQKVADMEPQVKKSTGDGPITKTDRDGKPSLFFRIFVQNNGGFIVHNAL